MYINLKVKSLEIRPLEAMLKKGGISPIHIGEIGFKSATRWNSDGGQISGIVFSSAKTPSFIRLAINRREETEN